jgi:hypothetical protein
MKKKPIKKVIKKKSKVLPLKKPVKRISKQDKKIIDLNKAVEGLTLGYLKITEKMELIQKQQMANYKHLGGVIETVNEIIHNYSLLKERIEGYCAQVKQVVSICDNVALYVKSIKHIYVVDNADKQALEKYTEK